MTTEHEGEVDWWRRWHVEGRRAARIAPVEAALGMALAASIIAGVEAVGPTDTWLPHVVASLCLALLLVAAISSLHAIGALSSRSRWGLTALFLGASGLYGAALFEPEHLAEGWRLGLMLAAAAGGLMLTPMAARTSSQARRALFWHFNHQLLERSLMVVFTLGVIFFGLVLAMAAVQELFELRIEDRRILQLWALLGPGLAPGLVAAGLPGMVSHEEEGLTERNLVYLERGLAWLIVPMVSLYMLIMLTYTFVVLGTGDAPSNVLSPLALGAGLLLLLGGLLVEPLRQRQRAGRLCKVLAVLPALYLALLPLPIWAIAQRIEQYGWTEFRHVRLLALVCLGLVCGLSALQLVRRRRQPLAAHVAIFAAGALLAALGPWSVVDVSRASQLTRLRQVMAAAGVQNPQGRLDLVSCSARHDRATHQTLDYLHEHHGWDVLDEVWPVAGVLPSQDPDRRDEVLHHTSFHIPAVHTRHWMRLEGRRITHTGMVRSISMIRSPDPVRDWEHGALVDQIAYFPEGTVDLAPCLASVREHLSDHANLATNDRLDPLPPCRRLELRDESGDVAGELVPGSLGLERDGEDDLWRPHKVDGLLIIDDTP